MGTSRQGGGACAVRRILSPPIGPRALRSGGHPRRGGRRPQLRASYRIRCVADRSRGRSSLDRLCRGSGGLSRRLGRRRRAVAVRIVRGRMGRRAGRPCFGIGIRGHRGPGTPLVAPTGPRGRRRSSGMKIRSIEVGRFGVWQELSLAVPARGLALFYGPNEAGKTTLWRFIRSVLYGFEPFAVELEDGTSRPVSWEGALRVEAHGGHYEIRRISDRGTRGLVSVVGTD